MKILSILLLLLLSLLYIPLGQAAKTPDPYKVLGVSRSATQDEIKKAFNKRSRQYHPDRNKQDPRAKQKFEKVVNAYQLLKDPERKRVYDMTGETDPNAANMGGGFGGFGGFGGGGINLQDILNMGFGGGFGGFGGGGGGGGGRRQGGQGNSRTYTFSFGGGGPGGFRFQM